MKFTPLTRLVSKFAYQDIPPPPIEWLSIPSARGNYDLTQRPMRLAHVGLTPRGLEFGVVKSLERTAVDCGYLFTAEEIAEARWRAPEVPAAAGAGDGRCVACYHTECGCPCATCVKRAEWVRLLTALTADVRTEAPICQCHRCDRVRRLHRHQAATGAPLSPRPGRCGGCGAALGHEPRGTEYSTLLEPGTGYSAASAVACGEACRESALDAAAARVGACRRR